MTTLPLKSAFVGAAVAAALTFAALVKSANTPRGGEQHLGVWLTYAAVTLPTWMILKMFGLQRDLFEIEISGEMILGVIAVNASLVGIVAFGTGQFFTRDHFRRGP